MKMFKRVVSFLICAVMSFTITYADFTPQIDIEDGEQMYDFFETLISVTDRLYRFDTDKEELYRAAIEKVLKENPELFDEFAKGAYSILDENSKYISTEEYEGVNSDVMGQFEGIGITVLESGGSTIVGSPIEGSPAVAAGLRAGDIIVSVDGVDIRNFILDRTISLIRGERGTEVTLGIERGESFFTVNVVRDTITINPVSHYTLDKNNSGYVKIASFNANTTNYLKEALTDLYLQGVDKIILDLRDNLGGLLSEAVSVASYFLPDNTLVVTEDMKDETKNKAYYSMGKDMKFKVVVLVNEYSASASEIVAGAIRDHEKGQLVGRTTFGKGTVQQNMRMKNGGGMWLTIARYLTPSGEYIHEKGIEPHHYITNKTGPMDMSNFEEVQGTRKLQTGDTGKDVLAIEQRLSAMGYYIDNVDEEYDAQTEAAVRLFQELQGLFPYGVADLTTQIAILEEAFKTEIVIDRQMDKALEIIYEMN